MSGAFASRAPLSEDITSPSAYLDMTTLESVFARLRREQPLAWVDREPYRPFWAIMRHADIVDIERQHETFINEPRLLLLPRPVEVAAEKQMTGGLVETVRVIAAMARLSRRPLGDLAAFVSAQTVKKKTGRSRRVRTIIDMDGPEHRKFRELTQAWFMGQGVKRLESHIDAMVNRSIATMRNADGQIDFARDIAMSFPLSVIMSILGLPEEDAPFVLRVTQQLLNASDPDLRKSEQYGADVVADLFEYYVDIIKSRRRKPTDDLTSVIANGSIDGKPLGPVETLSYLLIVTIAGHETTAAAIAGGMQAFIAHPGERVKVSADPEVLRRMSDEIVRWVTPVRHFCRTAVRDVDIRGTRIAAGESVTLFYHSANRDESAFDDPQAFRVDRRPNSHLGFGHGVHHCLGRLLALAEIRTFFASLLPRLGAVEFAGPIAPIESNFTAGLKHLPIRYRWQ